MRFRDMKKIFILLCLIVCSQNLSAQAFETDLRKAYTLLTLAQERDRQASEKLDDIKGRRIRIEEDLIDIQEKGKQKDKKEREKLEKQLKALKTEEREASFKRKATNDFLSQITDFIKTDGKKRAKFIAEYERKNGAIEDNKPVDNQVVTYLNNASVPAASEPFGNADKLATMESESSHKIPPSQKSEPNPNGKNKKEKQPKAVKKNEKKKSSGNLESNTGEPIIKKYDPKLDVILNPPVSDCKLAFDGIDNFTGRKKRETMPIILFRHTEDFMKASMKNKDYIVCEASATRVQGGFYYLNLVFTIQTKEAQKAFGFLDRSAAVVFKYMNGSITTLTNAKTDIGLVEPEKGVTTFKAQLQLYASEAKALGSAELDVVRVSWSAGYEDYEIFDVDVLQNLFRCLEKEAK